MSLDPRTIRAALRAQGWTLELTTRGHLRAVPPDPSRPAVVTGGTPSCSRAMYNWLAALRRSGFVWR